MKKPLHQKSFFSRMLRGWVALNLVVNAIIPSNIFAQESPLPSPGSILLTSPAFCPITMQGIRVHEQDPLLLDFIIDSGQSTVHADSDATLS